VIGSGTVPVPEPVRALFEGEDLEERFGLAYELATVDEDGWPRVAMLSHGEIVTTAESVRFVLWAGSTTGKNLGSGRPALLSVVSEGFVFYLSGHARILRSGSEFDSFEMSLEKVRSDAHEGFKVLAPITFGLESGDRGDALSEWRRQLERLRD
jgi:hypothetical protein